MHANGYQYTLSLFRSEGDFLGQVEIAPDFAPAVEWGRLQGLEEGALPTDPSRTAARIEPRWSKDGEAFLAGFRVAIADESSDRVTLDYPSTYFLEAAQKASSAFVESGRLEAGESFRYLVAAHPRPSVTKPRLTVERSPTPWRLEDGSSLSSFLAKAEECGRNEAVDPPVFLPSRLLDEAAELMAEAGSHETGGILIGHLHRDEERRRLFLELTALIPARHTRSAPLALTLTAETWTDVQAAIDLRGRDEVMLAWFHTHPLRHGCESCERKDRECCSSMNAAFFSAQDRALHRTAFPRAYSVALVVGDGPGDRGPSWALFGWRYGVIVRRGIHVLGTEEHGAGTPALGRENYASS